MYTQKTFVLKEADVEKKWYLIDAKDQIVGRVATVVADLLRGKNSPKFTPSMDSGAHVVVINAAEMKFTGKKLTDKIYYKHTRYTGGLKATTAGVMLANKPEEVLLLAVKGMLPKTSQGKRQLTKCKVFAGPEHTHEAQKPEVYVIK